MVRYLEHLISFMRIAQKSIFKPNLKISTCNKYLHFSKYLLNEVCIDEFLIKIPIQKTNNRKTIFVLYIVTEFSFYNQSFVK